MRHSIAQHALTECEPLIERAVQFAAALLKYTDSIYPFAVLSINGDVQCVCCEKEQAENGNMIEMLEWLIVERSFQTQRTNSVLVYLANVVDPQQGESDVIVTQINDSTGAEITRLYPYAITPQGVSIGMPSTF